MTRVSRRYLAAVGSRHGAESRLGVKLLGRVPWMVEVNVGMAIYRNPGGVLSMLWDHRAFQEKPS